MGDLESLLLVLAAIYLIECVVWLPRGSVALAAWWGRRFRVIHPGTLNGNHRGGLFLVNPFPPLGTMLVSQAWPLSLSPEGVFAYTAACLNPAGRPMHSGRYVRFEAIQSVSADAKKVMVNGEFFLKAGSPFGAEKLVRQIEQLRALPLKDRASAIRGMVEGGFRLAEAEGRLQAFQQHAPRIRVLSNVLWLYLFLVAPVLASSYGLAHIGWPLLAGLFAQTFAIAFLFRRAHRILYPTAGEERFKHFLTMLLAPPSAIRACDPLSRHLLADAHVLAVEQALLPRVRFEAEARRLLLDLRHPLLPVCPAGEPAAARTEAWFRAALVDAMASFLGAHGTSPEKLVAAPERSEPANQTYCPRCETQFVLREGMCADCGGQPLLALPT